MLLRARTVLPVCAPPIEDGAVLVRGTHIEAVGRFADKGVNLHNIQSMPFESEGWSYLFFLELAGHGTDRQLVSAFEEVRKRTRLFKILGSYVNSTL